MKGVFIFFLLESAALTLPHLLTQMPSERPPPPGSARVTAEHRRSPQTTRPRLTQGDGVRGVLTL